MLPVKRHLTDILTMTIFHFTHKILVKLALPDPLGMHRMECGADYKTKNQVQASTLDLSSRR